MHTTLIDPATLRANLAQRRWRIVDCRAALQDPDFGRTAYARGHIPGAVFADLEADLSGPVGTGTGRHPLPDRETLTRKLGEWGIDEQTQIVAYDAGPGPFAARFWWLARWLGHPDVAVLDGGLAAWERAAYPLSTEASRIRPARFPIRPALTRTTTTDEVAARLTEIELLDARDEARFRGEQEPIDPVAGHIPGASCLPFHGNLDADGRFRPVDALRSRFEPHLRSGSAVVCYCGSGVTAAHIVLAMVHAGLPEPSLYPGSWSEWITDPSRPIER
jgi:thiosulfate/3-mercaptopyruvate sulfurtransferase